MPRLRLQPISLRAANAFVAAHHRHHDPDRGCRFCLAVYLEDRLVGVAIVGRTKAQALQNDLSAEITRVCTDGTPNACSFLYGACRRVWQAMGGDPHQLYTYTQEIEPGVSLEAADYQLQAHLKARGSWNCKVRQRKTDPNPARKRWVAA